MKQLLYALLLVVILMEISTNTVFAETIDTNEVEEEKEIDQQEIDRRMKIVFDYLHEHANNVEFNGESSVTFDIPVGEDIVVNAEISNQEAFQARVIGSSTFSVKANTIYNYKLTLKNIVGSGDTTVYTVNYKVGKPVSSGKNAYWLTVNRVTIKGTAPSGYSLGNSSSWIGNTNGTLIVNTGGYIKYTRVFWADKTINFDRVTLGSVVESKVIVDYSYFVN